MISFLRSQSLTSMRASWQLLTLRSSPLRASTDISSYLVLMRSARYLLSLQSSPCAFYLPIMINKISSIHQFNSISNVTCIQYYSHDLLFKPYIYNSNIRSLSFDPRAQYLLMFYGLLFQWANSQISIVQTIMSQQFLTNYSVVVIKYLDDNQVFFLTNHSFIRSEVLMSHNNLQSTFENFLFYVEVTGGGNDFKSSIEFEQNIVLRHKISNRYLSYNEEFQDEQNDTTVKLSLSHKPMHFKILPCFQYQTKISNKVKFYEDVFLATQLSTSKHGYLSVRNSDVPSQKRTLIGLNLRSKINFHSYFEKDKDENGYTYGQGIWLTHIQSHTFLTVHDPDRQQNILFENIDPEERLQSINGLWVLESVKTELGGSVYFNEVFRLKSLCSSKYLAFSRNYKLVENERVYSLLLEERPSQSSKFVFQSLKGEQNRILKGSYLIFKHQQSGEYIGTRKSNRRNQFSQHLPVSNFSQFEDEDLFEIKELQEQAEQAIRFIFSIKRQFCFINACLQRESPFSQRLIQEIEGLYNNIILELNKLALLPQLFQQVQQQLGPYIRQFSRQLQQIRNQCAIQGSHPVLLTTLLTRIYSILIIICSDYKHNQVIAYSQLSIFAADIFRNLQAQELIAEIFKNNYSLLCKLPNPVKGLDNLNLVQAMFRVIVAQTDRTELYWKKILKIYDLLEVLLTFNGARIDINQRLISTELFQEALFNRMFVEVKAINQRIRIMQVETGKWIEIQQVKDQLLKLVIEREFNLLSKLCENRNFISKRHINHYLSQHSKNGIQVLISYLNVPISQALSNNLFSLLTNCYIDSAPRLNRHKPLPVIQFVVNKMRHKEYSSRMSAEEDLISDRLKEHLLGQAEQHYATRPIQPHPNNSQPQTLNEPSMNSVQLTSYKEELSDKIRQKKWSPDLLASICILIRLESYTADEMEEIKTLLDQHIADTRMERDILSRAMEIYEELATYCLQTQLKKVTAYMELMFTEGWNVSESTIPHFLSSAPTLPVSNTAVQITTSRDQRLELQKKKDNIEEYNRLVDVIKRFNPSLSFRQRLLELFISGQEESFGLLNSLFTVLMRCQNPTAASLRILNQVIIVTKDDMAVYDNLYSLYRRLKHLGCISQHWLANLNHDGQEFKEFTAIINQLTDYMFEDYELGHAHGRNSMQLNINHQLLLKNLGIHPIIVELLRKNFYLVEGKTKKDLPKKQRETLQRSFQFLYYFCKGCPQNIALMVNSVQVLDRFRPLCEVGQTRLFILLYRQEPTLTRQVKANMVEVMVGKILKQSLGESRELCEYNPELVEYLRGVCQIKGRFYKKNGEMVYKLLLKQNMLRRMLYMQEKEDRQGQMCLDFLKFRAQPLQIPYIYHQSILSLVVYLIHNLQTSGSFLKNKLKQQLHIDYLFRLMAEPDIYNSTGIVGQLNHLLKHEIIAILHIYLEKNDSLSRLHQNQYLTYMLENWRAIFSGKAQMRLIQIENQLPFMPYLKKHKQQLDNARNNMRDYYLEQVRPLLGKLMTILEKGINKQQNRNYQLTLYLLEDIDPQNLTHNHLLQQAEIGMNLVNLKWRNFVDNDVDNSREEKFAKQTVLEVLRHPETYRLLQKERHQYHCFLQKKEVEYIKVMARLIKMASEQQNRLGQSYTSLYNFHQLIHSLAQYLVWRIRQFPNQKQKWQGEQLVSTLISYITRQTFNYNHKLSRRSAYEVFRIMNFLLQVDTQGSLLKVLYRIFTTNYSCYKFFNCLRDALSQVSDRLQGQKYYQQVDVALSQLYLCGQQRRIQVDKQALKLITLLCKHLPFTQLLRNQPYQSSIDFLDKIYNSFFFMIRESHSERLVMSISMVDISQCILECMQAMLNGCNQSNQNFIIDNKFADIVVEALKMESIPEHKSKLESTKRDRLLEEVCEFYSSNGIDLAPILVDKIAKLDFKGVYLLNRFKYSMLRVVVQCVLANPRTTNKVRIMVPLELLKINLIWLYEDYKREKIEYTEMEILRQKEDWSEVVGNHNIKSTFLLIGFYFYHLIQLSNQNEKEVEEEEVEITNDPQKQKEKIIKKFFSCISDKEENPDKLKAIQQQPLAQQMTEYYHKYYEAYTFFRQKTLSVEAEVFGNLVRLYFPRLPLCDKLTPKLEQKLIENAQRISHDEKLKSLMEFEAQTYQILQGEQDYFKSMQEDYPLILRLVKLVQEEDDAFLVLWVMSCLIILLYIITDHQQPNKKFEQSLGAQFDAISGLTILLLILSLLNLLIGLVLLINLISKKIPFLNEVATRKAMEISQKPSWWQKTGFRLKYILSTSFFDIYVIVFSTLSILHPLFSGFLLVYIVKRIALGKQIVQAIEQTWFSLAVATALLIVFNYFYSIFIYSISYTDDIGYGVACQNLFRCLMLLVDQSLKSDSGFLGSVDTNFVNNKLSFKFLCEIVYIIFAQKVIFEIFSGTIIDKFSQLRQKSETTQQDENSMCFICDQERFQIDFELEGFQEHVEITHNKLNYVFYMFYLRRKKEQDFGIEQQHIWHCHLKDDLNWIPDSTSLLRQLKDEEEDQQPTDGQEQPQYHQQYYEKKHQELKKVRLKLENLSSQLKQDNT